MTIPVDLDAYRDDPNDYLVAPPSTHSLIKCHIIHSLSVLLFDSLTLTVFNFYFVTILSQSAIKDAGSCFRYTVSVYFSVYMTWLLYKQ